MIRTSTVTLMFLALLAFEPPRAQAAWPGRPGGGGDDTYQFATGIGQQLVATVTSTAGGARVMVQLSPVKAWDTALLGVRLTAKAGDTKIDPNVAPHVDPYVDVSVGSMRVRQHLDPGAHGLRWLNLTGLRGSLVPGALLEMRASGIQFQSGDATLRLFDSGPPLDGRILVLAPHPDDAEIAAFGLYADRNATIVTVTSGNAGRRQLRRRLSRSGRAIPDEGVPAGGRQRHRPLAGRHPAPALFQPGLLRRPAGRDAGVADRRGPGDVRTQHRHQRLPQGERRPPAAGRRARQQVGQPGRGPGGDPAQGAAGGGGDAPPDAGRPLGPPAGDRGRGRGHAALEGTAPASCCTPTTRP